MTQRRHYDTTARAGTTRRRPARSKDTAASDPTHVPETPWHRRGPRL